MRKKRDAEGTRKKILEAAEKLFAARGFNGTSIAMISKTSGISDGLILYHYKTKENLYRHVIEKASGHYLKIITGPLSAETSVRESMKNALIAAFDFWKNDKISHRLGLWAYLEGREVTSENEAKLTLRLTEYLLSLQKKGHFPRDFHPVVFLTVIIGSIQFWFRYKSRFLASLDMEKQTGEADNLFLRQFAALLEKAVFK